LKIKVNIIITKLKDSCKPGILSAFYFLMFFFIPSYFLSNSVWATNLTSTADSTYVYKSDSSFIKDKTPENDSVYIIGDTEISGKQYLSDNTVIVDKRTELSEKKAESSGKVLYQSSVQSKKSLPSQKHNLLFRSKTSAEFTDIVGGSSELLLTNGHFRFLSLLSVFILLLILSLVNESKGISIFVFLRTRKGNEQYSRPPPSVICTCKFCFLKVVDII
jgi:hypothetical protein